MVRPQPLKIGDRVAVTAPASRVGLEDVLQGLSVLDDWRLDVTLGQTVGENYYNFSDTYENRLQELQSFLDDPSIKCIFAARGGYGISDLLDKLDFTKFKKEPKWVVGFSDITALILHLNSLGISAIHGPMVKTFSFDELSLKNLFNLLFLDFESIYKVESLSERVGIAKGKAIGGNLALLAHSVGSKSDISFDGKILFLEDVGEKHYNIDRMMVQLKRAGKLDNLAGLVAGNFSDMEDDHFGKTSNEIILHHTKEFTYPIALNFKFGHLTENFPVVMGDEYLLEVKPTDWTLQSYRNETV